MMTRSPDEIKKGLECCGKGLTWDETCGTGCPYEGMYITGCSMEISADALALIQKLEEQCKHMNDLRDAAAERALKMEERVHQLEAERDAAVACLKKAANEKGECFGCKWYNGKNCTHPDYKMLCSSHDDKWQWIGVQKEE